MRTLVVTLILAAVPATASVRWEALTTISAAADSASAWADSARQHARAAKAWQDSTIAWADSVITREGVAADEARDRAMEFFHRTYDANERAGEAWGRARAAERRALDGRNAYLRALGDRNRSWWDAWHLRDPGGVIAVETWKRARQAEGRAYDAE